MLTTTKLLPPSRAQAFVSNTTGYLPLDVNGVGTEIVKTTDGGFTWGPAAPEPFALLLLDIAAFGPTDVAVVGALSMEYSTDGGASFNESASQFGAGQCIRAVGPRGSEEGFAAVGQWGLFTEANGIVFSTDGGKAFSVINTTLTADARYGAFPSDSTWFLTAGDWPGEQDDNPPEEGPYLPEGSTLKNWVVDPAHYFTPVPPGAVVAKLQNTRVHYLRDPASQRLTAAAVHPAHIVDANRGPHGLATMARAGGWEAQIAATTDAGKTWTVQFSKGNQGDFYFNGIECFSTTACCAVGEGGNGTYIHCTQDGGSSWVETLCVSSFPARAASFAPPPTPSHPPPLCSIDDDPNSSLTDIACVGPTEAWAVGGEMGLLGPATPTFLHTLDSGATWVKQNDTTGFPYGVYPISIDCVPGAACWSTLLDVLTQETSIAAVFLP